LIATSAVMTSLLQSSRDQFCNLHVGLQDEIYDGWDKRFFIEPHLTNFLGRCDRNHVCWLLLGRLVARQHR
jgi:hypothetical protein